MSWRDNLQSIRMEVDRFAAFSDHEHHQADGFFQAGMDLDKALANAYVTLAPFGDTPPWLRTGVKGFPRARRFGSYFHWFAEGVKKVHNLGEDLSPENWECASAKVAATHRDPDFHWKSLLANGYDKIVQDAYWDPGSDNGHPGVFLATFRVDGMTYGHHRLAERVEGGPIFGERRLCPWERYGFAGGGLDDYVDHIKGYISDLKRSGKIVSLKTAIAYNRTIDFYPDDREAAKAAFGKTPESITPRELQLFGNYIFHRCFDAAAELGLPVQIHTGLARMGGSNPLLLERLIQERPGVRFVLFHSGYPWIGEAAALAHHYANVCPNLTWTPIISTSAAVRALDEFIDTAQSIDSITWGGDAWVPEESVGAQLAWRHVVASVLAKRHADGLLRAADIELLAKKLISTNGRHVYLGEAPEN